MIVSAKQAREREARAARPKVLRQSRVVVVTREILNEMKRKTACQLCSLRLDSGVKGYACFRRGCPSQAALLAPHFSLWQ
jgi:hypothetical protein